MSNLTRFDPFPLEPMSELFQGLFRPLRGAGGDAPLADIKVDVTESDTAYTVKAELPGVEKNGIDVKIDGNLVSISARVERNQELKEGERVVRRERYSGAVSRSFSLASEIDEATAAAQYKDGVLSLTLPKKAASGRKRLPISRLAQHRADGCTSRRGCIFACHQGAGNEVGHGIETAGRGRTGVGSGSRHHGYRR